MEAHEWDTVLDVLRRPEAARQSLEARVQLIEDKQRIRELVMLYGLFTDAKRYDELFELYADDIERELAGTLTEQVKGKPALLELMRRPQLPRKSGGGDLPPPEAIRAQEMRHLTAGEIIRVSDDGTQAWFTSHFMMVKTIDDPVAGFRRGAHEGTYVFTFRKLAGDWKFSRMLVITNNAHNPLYQRSSTASTPA
jgi:hypothetical protein